MGKNLMDISRSARGGNGILDASKLGEGLKFLKIDEGEYELNFLLYKISSKKNPSVVSGDLEVGDVHFITRVKTHYGVGGVQKSVICPSTFGKACPICEYASKLPDGDEKKELRAKERALFLVENARKEDSPVYVLELAAYYADDIIDASYAKGRRRGTAYVPFFDDGDVEGQTVLFTVDGKGRNRKFKNIDFVERENRVSKKNISTAMESAIDSALVIPTYDELKALLAGGYDDDEEQAPRKHASEDDEPTPRKKAQSREDELDEEPETAIDAAPQKKAESDECPYGHKFGADLDEFNDCDTCRMARKCEKAGA